MCYVRAYEVPLVTSVQALGMTNLEGEIITNTQVQIKLRVQARTT